MKHWQRAALALLKRRRWSSVTDAELVERARAERAALVTTHGEDAVRALEQEWRADDSTTERG